MDPIIYYFKTDEKVESSKKLTRKFDAYVRNLYQNRDYQRCIVEIEHCLQQFNQKADFTSLYKYHGFTRLKEKLLEYEKKHPIKKKVVVTKKKK